MAKEWGIRALSFLWIGNILPPSFQSNLPHVRPKDYPRAATKSALLWQQPEQQLLNTVMDLHRLPPLFSRTTTKKNKTLLPSISCLEILLNTCTVCVLKHVEKKGWPWLFEDLTRKKISEAFWRGKSTPLAQTAHTIYFCQAWIISSSFGSLIGKRHLKMILI